jgi:SpoVK/Ycf46/Vps4 family AAA+-type ATPase
LNDFHDVWNEMPASKRRLRSVAQHLKNTQTTIVITIPSRSIPPELQDEATVVDLSLPNEKQLDEVLEDIVSGNLSDHDISPAVRLKTVRAAIGLTASQARRAFAEAIVKDGTIAESSIDFVMAQKKQVIRQSEALEFYDATESVDNVGGLDVLKNWLRAREAAFSKEAAKYRLPAPKGIVLLGIPGTGKSLTAKMVSGLWRMPLLRLDVGAIFGMYVGQSEERLRKATQLAETVAPCVLWIDELEKAFGSQGGLDGGTSTRVFGTLLSWMQDKRAPVFIVATANDVSKLPPELLRRGRFDEIFFLDLPNSSEREEILKVHLRKVGRNPKDFDVKSVAGECENFVGAEIEQVVAKAMYRAFGDGGREFTTEDLLAGRRELIPLASSQRERIESLRDWLREGRALSASREADKPRGPRGKLEI